MPGPKFLPCSNPSSHNILEVTTSNSVSIGFFIIFAIAPVHFLAFKIAPFGNPWPIFSEILCFPKGVLKLFSFEPVPYAEVEML